MKIKWLEVNNFRNITEARIEFETEGITAIVGENAQGKTNLLEAICYCANARSFRVSDKESVIAKGADQAVLRAEFLESERSFLVETTLSVERRTRVILNKKPFLRIGTLPSYLPLISFIPEDLGIVKDGPTLRREYLDQGLRLASPTLGGLIDDLDRVLRQRNVLLRQAQGHLNREIEDSLGVWDDKFTELGSELVRRRIWLVTLLLPYVEEAVSVVTGGRYKVEMQYQPSWSGDLKESMRLSRDEDIKKAVTNVGPHRDDVAISVNGLSVRTGASQGEQRLIACALKIALVKFLTAHRRTNPIFILDDVLSELDAQRSSLLLKAIPNGQSFLSSTQLPNSEGVFSGLLQVKDGRVF